MPTAELLKPVRLNYLGRIWEKGVREPIDNETAALLEDNPRFRVKGYAGASDRDDEDEVRVRRPKSKADLAVAIRAAVDELDVDDDANFTASGEPNHFAVSAVLGYQVTADDVSAAMKAKVKPAETEDDLEDLPKGKAARSNVKIKRVPREQAEKSVVELAKRTDKGEAPKVETDDGEGSGGKDPSTEGAMEV